MLKVRQDVQLVVISGKRSKLGFSYRALTDVTSDKGDDELLWFAALTPWFGDNIFVEHFYSPLEAGELHHGVGDLPHPQGNHTFIEPGQTTQVTDPIQMLSLNSKFHMFEQSASHSEHLGLCVRPHGCQHWELPP